MIGPLVNFFNSWSTSTTWSTTTWCTSWHTTWHTAWHTTWHTIGGTTCSLIHFGDDWTAYLLHIFLSVFIFLLLSKLICIQPLNCLITLLKDALAISIRNLVLELLIFNS